MISENRQSSNCDIRFGVSGLRNTSLMENFYPADIPEEWLLDYYRNEFSLILMGVSDLTSHSTMIKQSDAMLADTINELYEHIVGEDFIVLLDVSEVSEERVKKLLPERKTEAKTLFFINLKKMTSAQSPIFSVPLKWHNYQGQSDNCLLYYVTEQQAIEPIKLKEMITQIREHASAEEAEIVNVVFSSSQNALENCRNAILLESMM